MKPQSIFEDEGGAFAKLSQISITKYAKGWGRWLGFLAGHEPEALALTPSERCTKPRLQAYIDHLRTSGNSEGTVINRLMEISASAQAMDPSFKSQLIDRFIASLRHKVVPVHSKSHVRPANELVDLGISLMEQATDTSDHKHALGFRDGLIIAFLALHPVRRRNLAAFEIGKNLVPQGDNFVVSFGGDETKNGTPHEAVLADILIEPMRQYLRLWRPVLAKRQGRWRRSIGQAVWVSANGSPMTQEGLAGRIELRTKKALGKAMSPHRFRDSAATTMVMADPVRIRATAPLLGHRSLATTEKHYIQARGLQAQRSYLEVLQGARRGEKK